MFSDLLSQPVLTQPTLFSASPGAFARFAYTMSNGFSVSGFYIYWYQQKPGALPDISCTTAQNQKSTMALGSTTTFLDPKTLHPVQVFCTSLGHSLRTRLTIIAVYGMAAITLSAPDSQESQTKISLCAASLVW